VKAWQSSSVETHGAVHALNVKLAEISAVKAGQLLHEIEEPFLPIIARSSRRSWRPLRRRRSTRARYTSMSTAKGNRRRAGDRRGVHAVDHRRLARRNHAI
jgi:hypothetical protein